ncbi:MAG TPA: TonB-dependent receptor [Caulobacterales bacterium]|nr:TonB-dependent receptor [Caulobacterales bacterium]
MKFHALWLSASVLTLGWCGAAAAQTATAPQASNDTSDEIVVTAERRTQNLQTAPISATVISGDDLANKGVTTVDSLQFVSPAATVNNFGQGNNFNIRGIGKGEHNTQTSTGVITYRDGVATFPGYFTLEPYYDIASVEILRGPQGTFGGQNATGGAVFVTTNNPRINGGFHGYIAGQLGNYNDVATQGAINLPISDTLAARIAFNTETRDSFYTITGPGGAPYNGNPGDLEMYSGRLSVLWQPTAALSALWKTDLNYLDFGGYPADPYNAPNDPFHLSFNSRQQALDRGVRSSLKVDYTFGSGLTLRSMTGYQYALSQYTADLDGTSTTNWTFGDVVPTRLWSQEVDVISPDDGFVTWIVGAYADYLKYWFSEPWRFYIGTPPGNVATEYLLQGTNPEQHSAVFGQVSFNFSPSWQLQVGGRYTRATTKNHGQILQNGLLINNEQSARFTNFSGKIALNWTINDDNFAYAFVSSGFRPGGLNVPVGLGPPAPFDEEKVLSYEIGWKNIAFNGHLRTQVDAYYNDYDNFQVTVGYPTFPTFGFELNVPNTTEMYGFEMQTEASFGHFSLDAGLGWVHSSLGDFWAVDTRNPAAGLALFYQCLPESGPTGAPMAPYCIYLGGKEQTYAPSFTFNIGAQYDFRLSENDTLTPRVNFGHVSEQWATLFENEAFGDRIGARNVWNGQLAWTHGDIITTLYGTNISDEHYVGALNSGLRFMGPPRQYGVRVSKLF